MPELSPMQCIYKYTERVKSRKKYVVLFSFNINCSYINGQSVETSSQLKPNTCKCVLMKTIPHSYISARCTTLCNKVCQLLATGRWFFRVLRFTLPI